MFFFRIFFFKVILKLTTVNNDCYIKKSRGRNGGVGEDRVSYLNRSKRTEFKVYKKGAKKPHDLLLRSISEG